MAKKEIAFFSFNRGLASPLSLARVDMRRLAFSAQVMTNFMPRVLGSMMLRPGMAYLGSSNANAQARYIPFIFATSDTALIEFTDSNMRVWLNDAPITRVAVGSTVTNGGFDTNLNNWTQSDESGGTSSWQTGGYLGLVGDGTNAAIRDQQITVAAGDQNVEHALRVTIQRGPVTFLVGSTQGGSDYVAKTTLDTGVHSLAFTPTGNFWIRFQSALKRITLVDSVAVEAAGIMVIPAPYTVNDLYNIRYDQSGDIVFLACKTFLQRKVERRSTRSWSISWYLSDNGPYLPQNATETTIAASATSGNVTLTASRAIFNSGHVGCLFAVQSVGQAASANLAAQNTFTSTIQVTGVGEARRFAITISGTWAGTITLQRSIGVTGNWVDVSTYTSGVTTTYDDALDNQTVFYQIGFKTGQYTSGTAVTALNYPLGSITGVGRVTGFTDSTHVSAEVTVEFGNTTASKLWSQGSWSTDSGFPTAVTFYEGRLWWAGQNGIFASASDDFFNFNPNTVGDAGPINHTIGSGPVDNINWLLPLQRMIVGAEGAEHSIRATSFDEVLTPTNFNIKQASSLGSAGATAVRVDSRGLFIQRGGSRVFELAFDANVGDYASTEASIFCPEVGVPSLLHAAVQRLPDTRVHFVRSDGVVSLLVYNPIETVICWVNISSPNGFIEDVVVLPGSQEDAVYYSVRRVINGSTVRYLEKFALETEARGGNTNKTSDAFIKYVGAATTTITGLNHLEGQTVCVWGNGTDMGLKTVVGGQITTLSQAVTEAYVGLPYTAQWQSTKLSYVSPYAIMGTQSFLGQPRRISQVGFVLAYAYSQALMFGPDFNTLDSMPGIEDDNDVADAQVTNASYDERLIEFPGTWGNDSRLCLQAASPRPVTVLAAMIAYELEAKE